MRPFLCVLALLAIVLVASSADASFRGRRAPRVQNNFFGVAPGYGFGGVGVGVYRGGGFGAGCNNGFNAGFGFGY